MCVHQPFPFGPVAATHVAQRMSELREFDVVPLKRAARYLVGSPKLQYDSEYKNKLTKSVSVDFDFADDPASRKHEETGGADWEDAVGLSFRSTKMDLGIQLKVEMWEDHS